MMTRAYVFTILALLSMGAHATRLTIQYTDEPGIGFLDETPVSAVEGNTATTLGGQRKVAFEYVVKRFERMVWITDEISPRIRTDFALDLDRFPNLIGLAIGGSHAPFRIPSDVPNIQPNTRYQHLLYARLSGTLGVPSVIGQTHEGEIQFSPQYDFDLTLPVSEDKWKQLASTVMHEFLHLAGFGSGLSAFNATLDDLDIFARQIAHEGATPRSVEDMDLTQVRAMLDDPDGPRFSGSDATKSAAPTLITMGEESGEIFLADDADHLSDTVFPRSIMARGSGNTMDVRLIAYMLSDLGWGPVTDTSVDGTTDSTGISVQTSADQINQNVVTKITVPDGLTIDNVNGAPATCTTDAQTITCSYEELQANQPQIIAVNFEGNAGIYKIAVDVDHQDFHVDPIPTNNFASLVLALGENPITGLELSENTVSGKAATGQSIGTITASLSDNSQQITYALVSGDGDTDNANYTLTSAGALANRSALDVETARTESIRVRATTDNGYTKDNQFNIEISGNPITSIALSSASVSGNSVAGTNVGQLSTASSDSARTFTYALVAGTGDTNNSAFRVAGDQLQLATNLNVSSSTSYSARIQSTADNGYTSERSFSISITGTTTDCLSAAPSLLPFNQAYAGTTSSAAYALWPIQLGLIVALFALMRLVRQSSLNRTVKWSLLAILSLGLMACGGGGGGGGSPC